MILLTMIKVFIKKLTEKIRFFAPDAKIKKDVSFFICGEKIWKYNVKITFFLCHVQTVGSLKEIRLYYLWSDFWFFGVR